MTLRQICLSVLILPQFLLGCSAAGSPADLDAVRTEAVSTYQASLTGAWTPSPSPSASLTSLPTFTQTVATTTAEIPPTANPCYDLLWIEDRTIPDGARLKSNETFSKTWLVQNNGGCAWAPGFSFRHVGGDPLRAQPLVLGDPVPVGAKREISIEMVAPGGEPGLVQSSWRMADLDGNFFGDTLSVNILVGEPAAP